MAWPNTWGMTRLTEHFTLRELTRSGTALRRGLGNEPSPGDVERLTLLCRHVLEPLRRRFGVLRITSGYRSRELNRLVGGVADSQHCLGEAADVYVGSMEVAEKMYGYAVERLDFDQLILERRGRHTVWLHVSYRDGRNRRQHFVADS